MIIKEITLENFQKHQKLNIKLDKFNIIIGKSSSGKTSIFRALKFLFLGEWDKTYPLDNSKDTIVSCLLNNNILIKRIKKQDKNIAIITDGKEELKLENFGAIIPGIERFIDVNDISLEKNVNLNFSMQDDKLFILNETKTVKAKTIGKLFGADVINDLLSIINKDKRNKLEELKELDKEINEIKNLLNNKHKLDEINELFNKLKQKQDLINKIKKLKDSIFFYKENLKILKKFEKILSIDLNEAYKKVDIYFKLSRFFEIDQKIDNYKRIINHLENINEYKNNLENKKKIYNNIYRLIEIKRKIGEFNKELAILNLNIKNAKDVILNNNSLRKCPICYNVINDEKTLERIIKNLEILGKK